MDHSPCGTATLFHLLRILFFLNLFLPGVDAQTSQQQPAKSHLLNRCPASTSNPWWEPLVVAEVDPCQGFARLVASNKFTINCCFNEQSSPTPSKRGDNDKDQDKSDGGTCGPCTIQTYNLASECIACEHFPGSQAPSNNQTANDTVFMFSKAWMANDKRQSHHSFFPRWLDTPATGDDQFDVEKVLQYAKANSHFEDMKNNGTTPATSSSSVSATSSASQNAASSTRNGAIAGGAIAGLLFLTLIALGLLYFLRKRRRQRSAPSSEFTIASGPTAQVQEEKPSSFSSKSWRAPALKKWHTGASSTSQHGLMSNAAWNRDIEKEKY